MTVVRLNNLGKDFLTLRGRVTAVTGINLAVEPGEFFVLLGPSGCGKSTLLNLIAGLERPTRGEVWLGEKLAAAGDKKVFLTPRERDVAMVFQSYALYPHLSVFENIAFPLRIAKTKEYAEKVERTAALLGIENLLERKPSELSGGQRQRVAIGRALVRQPRIFLLDEPLSNLDAQLRVDMRAELKSLQRRIGVSTVYVTHDQIEAMTLGDRLAVMREGAIEQVGTPREIYSAPVNTFVARFVGSPPMNLFAGKCGERGNSLFFKIGTEELAIPPEKGKELRPLNGSEVILGIRPEDIFLRPLPSTQGEGIKARVELLERLGSESLLHFKVDTAKGTARLGSEVSVTEGEEIRLFPNMKNCHIFAKDGKRLSGENRRRVQPRAR